MAPKRTTVRTTRRRIQSADTLDEQVHALVSVLSERAEPADDPTPHIVRITRADMSGSGIDVGLRPVDGVDGGVVGALTGFTAPSDWLAIGVSTGGNAFRVEAAGAATDEEPRRVHLVHLVTRRGASASAVRIDGDEPKASGRTDPGAPTGRVDDVCRRALGLPTAPPGSTTELWALSWLGRLVSTGLDRVPTTWEQVAALHTAAAVMVDADPALSREVAMRLVRLGELLSSIIDWPAVRAECVAGRWDGGEISPTVARWLDDGAFSRWVLASFPPVGQLAAAACELLEPALARRVRSTLRAWHLPTGAGAGADGWAPPEPRSS